jgi:hypothetical protein
MRDLLLDGFQILQAYYSLNLRHILYCKKLSIDTYSWLNILAPVSQRGDRGSIPGMRFLVCVVKLVQFIF